MSRHRQSARNYLPSKVDRLMQATHRIQKLHASMHELSQDIMLDIIDGWTSGDTLLDFVLLACDGVYDPFILALQYRKLHEIGLRKPQQLLLVTQKALYYNEEGDEFYLCNIHLAVLRAEHIHFDNDSLVMRLPVEPGHLIWSEFYDKKGLFFAGYKTLDDPWLTTGPLHNDYCDYASVRLHEDGHFYVPDDAVCRIDQIPPDDPARIEEEHGVDLEMLNYLRRAWFLQLATE